MHKLHIFKVYYLIHFGICGHPWNYLHNQDNKCVDESFKNIAFAMFKKTQVKILYDFEITFWLLDYFFLLGLHSDLWPLLQ